MTIGQFHIIEIASLSPIYIVYAKWPLPSATTQLFLFFLCCDLFHVFFFLLPWAYPIFSSLLASMLIQYCSCCLVLCLNVQSVVFKFSIHQLIFLKSFQVCFTVIIITLFFLSESGGESIYGQPFKVVS